MRTGRDPGYILTVLTRRSFLVAATGSLTASRWIRLGAQNRPVPSRAQLEWQRDELALFLHFGVNTFTDREWGDGSEDPGEKPAGRGS